MPQKSDKISARKKEHIELCLTDKVSFKNKTTGFELYDFEHYAISEVDIKQISFKTKFFNKEVAYPFLISCMTGGTEEAEQINRNLAISAGDLNIPLGVGSQRHALENETLHKSYKVIRQNAPNVPVLGNIGASQVVKLNPDKIKFLVDLVEADAMVVHINPAQELFQPDGEPYFKGLLKSIEKLVKHLPVPVIAKEVGSGISGKAAKRLLEAGVSGIDTAGAGGTSWTGVEMLRNISEQDDFFWDWGIPTADCIKEIAKLKKKNKFMLIGSGGINSPVDAAKAYALGADFTASARIILQTLEKHGALGVTFFITQWFEVIRKIMFLTGSEKLRDLTNNIIYKGNNDIRK